MEGFIASRKPAICKFQKKTKKKQGQKYNLAKIFQGQVRPK